MNQVITTAGTFWIYSVLCVIGVIFVVCFVPETKGRDLDSIAELFLKEEQVKAIDLPDEKRESKKDAKASVMPS